MVTMSDQPHGPGEPFEPLLDLDTTEGLSLTDGFQAIYGGDWRLPAPSSDRPYTYANFVTSRDGRISFDEPGEMGGGSISRFNRHDQWLMGLLRARADAIMVGDATLKLEVRHIWTAEAIFPDDADAWRTLRRHEGRSDVPLHVFLSMEGDVPCEAAIFARPDIPILIATPRAAESVARERLRGVPNVEVWTFGSESVDLPQLTGYLRAERGVDALLCEGGAHVYGAMIAAWQIDDEFLTLSPIFVGNRPRGAGKPRPSLVEGVAFSPDRPPIQRLLSVRRRGDHLFLRSRMRRD
jgi:riboflavin biosynthesis pyrimidine reductase